VWIAGHQALGRFGGPTVEHPASRSNRADRVGRQLAADADEQAVASPLAEITEAGQPGQLAPADHPADVRSQYRQHSPLLLPEADGFEGVCR
jgi:hypothetical protein